MESLYEKVGGEKTISKLVVEFYQHVLADPGLRPFFANVSIDKLIRMQKAFFTLALGGPEPETRISLYEAHRDRGIRREHLTRFTEHLLTTLRQVGIEESSVMDIYTRIASYADEVLGETGVDG